MSSARSILAVGALALFAPACSSFDTKDDPDRLQIDGPLSGYVSIDALEAHSKKLFSGDVLGSSEHPGELLAVDTYPLFGVGAGTSGVRARVLFLEMALGTILDPPKAASLTERARELLDDR